jgi:hypothetical protein
MFIRFPEIDVWTGMMESQSALIIIGGLGRKLYVFPQCLALWEPVEDPAPRGSERLLSNAQQLSDTLSLSPWALRLRIESLKEIVLGFHKSH